MNNRCATFVLYKSGKMKLSYKEFLKLNFSLTPEDRDFLTTHNRAYAEKQRLLKMTYHPGGTAHLPIPKSPHEVDTNGFTYVYGIYEHSDLMYIGSSIHPFSRYRNHKIHRKLKKGIHSLHLLGKGKDEQDMRKLEVRLIKTHMPPWNKTHKNS